MACPALRQQVRDFPNSIVCGLLLPQVKNPAVDMPLGIVGAVSICGVLYVALSLVLCAAVPYSDIKVGAPFSAAFLSLIRPADPPGGLRTAFLRASARFVSFGALTGGRATLLTQTRTTRRKLGWAALAAL